jgi:serine/threonine protein kinase
MVDIWSSGITLYAMLCGCLPFDEESKTALYEKILSCRFPIPKYISTAAADLLKKILVKDVDKRLRVKDILNHPWCRRHLDHLQTSTFGEDELDSEVVRQVHKSLQIPESSLRAMLADNAHNEYTTLYYLLSKQKERKVVDGDADKTVRFEPTPIEIKPLDLSAAQPKVINTKESAARSDTSNPSKSPLKKLSRKASQVKGSEKPPLSSKRRNLSRDGQPTGFTLKPPMMDLKDITVEVKEKITFSAKKSMDSKRLKSKERSGSGKRVHSNQIGGVKM